MKLNRIALFVLVLFAGTAMGVTTYPDVLGSADGQVDFLNIEETSVTDPTPLFGEPKAIYIDDDPLVKTSILLFKPDNFASYAENGEADNTAGKLSMDLRARGEGWFLNQIIVREIGDFGMTGAGSGSANVFGLLAAVNDLTGEILLDGLDVQPDPP